MTKYTVEERLAAEIAVEEGENITSVAKHIRMSEDVISRSMGLYREHGQAGLWAGR